MTPNLKLMPVTIAPDQKWKSTTNNDTIKIIHVHNKYAFVLATYPDKHSLRPDVETLIEICKIQNHFKLTYHQFGHKISDKYLYLESKVGLKDDEIEYYGLEFIEYEVDLYLYRKLNKQSQEIQKEQQKTPFWNEDNKTRLTLLPDNWTINNANYRFAPITWEEGKDPYITISHKNTEIPEDTPKDLKFLDLTKSTNFNISLGDAIELQRYHNKSTSCRIIGFINEPFKGEIPIYTENSESKDFHDSPMDKGCKLMYAVIKQEQKEEKLTFVFDHPIYKNKQDKIIKENRKRMLKLEEAYPKIDQAIRKKQEDLTEMFKYLDNAWLDKDTNQKIKKFYTEFKQNYPLLKLTVSTFSRNTKTIELKIRNETRQLTFKYSGDFWLITYINDDVRKEWKNITEPNLQYFHDIIMEFHKD